MTPASSLHGEVAGRPWVERHPGISWKLLREEGDRRAVLMRHAPGAVQTVHAPGGARVLAIRGGPTEPVPETSPR